MKKLTKNERAYYPLENSKEGRRKKFFKFILFLILNGMFII